MTGVLDQLATVGLPLPDRNVWVEVDLDVLASNAATLADLVAPHAELGVVVKADGYGHGLELAARAAARGGARWLCVAMLGEARRLRADGWGGRVFVLYPVPAHGYAEAAQLRLDVTIGSLEQAQAIAAAAPGFADPLRVHIEVDTGMTRGGMSPDQVTEAAAVLATPGVVVAGVWSHLAAPEAPESAAAQQERFRSAADRVSAAVGTPVTRHLCASGGLLASDIDKFDLVRIGLTYYGENPLPGTPLPSGIEPARTIRALPVRVAEVAPGVGVGYGPDWVARRTTRVATLPIGYADGWSRASSPGTVVLVDGMRAPLIGRVSSDAITVDVTDAGSVDEDAEFVLLGAQGDDRITADEVADTRDTISWEVLQQLHARLPRVYVTDGRPAAVRAHMTTDATVVDASWRGAYGTSHT